MSKIITPFRGLCAVAAASLLASLPLTATAERVAQPLRPAAVISITGQVTDRQGSVYTIRHKTGRVLIDLTGWPETRAGRQITGFLGDRITATGDFDAAFLRTGTLDAESVYNFDQHAYSSLVDQAPNAGWRSYQLPDEDWNSQVVASLVGEVTEVGTQQLIVRTGGSNVTVVTSPLMYNPLDDVGDSQLQVGDYIRVGGLLSQGFFEDRTINAYRLTTINLLTADS